MYQTLNTQQTRYVTMNRHGWFDPQFELNDGNALYGRLKYDWIRRRNAYAEAAGRRWTFRSPLFLRNGVDIIDESGAVVGEAWREFFSWTINVKLNNGFEAVFYRPSIFSRERVWESPAQGTFLRMYSYPFMFKDEFEITSPLIPAETATLLIMLSTHLTILLRRRRAVH